MTFGVLSVMPGELFFGGNIQVSFILMCIVYPKLQSAANSKLMSEDCLGQYIAMKIKL